MKEIRVIPEDHVPTIKVSDTATLEVTANRAAVDIEVTAQSREQKGVFARRDLGVAKVKLVLDRAPLLRRNAEELSEYTDYKNRIDSTWRCTLDTEDVANPEVREQLRDVLSRLAGLENCVVNGPQWALSAERQAEANAQAVAAAVQNARRKAEVLAQQLGGSLTGVIQIDSDATEVSATPANVSAAPVAAFSKSANLPERSLDIDARPGIITVTGTVTAIFAAEFPFGAN